MKRILAAVDFSPLTEPVWERAAELARAFGGELTLLHVAAPDPEFVGYEAGPEVVRDDRARELREERRRLEAKAEALSKAGTRASARLIAGPTAETIVAQAERSNSDLIIIGSHGHGAVYSALLGSVSERVLRLAPCPVLVVPASALRSGDA